TSASKLKTPCGSRQHPHSNRKIDAEVVEICFESPQSMRMWSSSARTIKTPRGCRHNPLGNLEITAKFAKSMQKSGKSAMNFPGCNTEDMKMRMKHLAPTRIDECRISSRTEQAVAEVAPP